MTAIERTAYPRFKRHPSAKELNALYTPTPEDIEWAGRSTRKSESRFTLLVLLKAFQRLGYFPQPTDIPPVIVQHMRGALHLEATVPFSCPESRTLYRHHQAVREYLGVRVYGQQALRLATQAMSDAASVMDNPADLINQ